MWVYNPAMNQITVDFPPALESWIEQQVAQGRFADAEEYVADLIRRDMKGAMPCK
jgi:antitoxin ParD1/3/4